MFRALTTFLVLNLSISVIYGQSAAELLTYQTKGFVSIPNVHELEARWQRTQLGILASDPVMKPFSDELRDQIRTQLIKKHLNVSISWDDIKAICKAEICLASVLPEDGDGYATVLIMDVSDRLPQANELLERVGADLVKEGAKKVVNEESGGEFVTLEMPRKRGQPEADKIVRFLANDRLVFSNHEKVCLQLFRRLAERDFSDSLAASKNFQSTVELSAAMDVNQHDQIRWFVEPFGFARLVEAANQENNGGRKSKKLAILQAQGFDAIQAVGGVIYLKTNLHELLHRAFVYAPPVEDAESSMKYKLAARMLQFPNSDNKKVPDWVPRDIGSFARLNWKLQDAFSYSSTLVDAIADSEIFEDVLRDLEKDPNGPKVNIREELIKYLQDELLILTDQVLPVTPSSERILGAIPLTDPAAVEKTLHKLFDEDPKARPIKIAGVWVWEMYEPDEDEDLQIPNLVIGAGDDEIEVEEDDDEGGTKKILDHFSISVSDGYLWVSSHLSMIEDLLTKRQPGAILSNSEDFNLIQRSMNDIGAGVDSLRFFARTDEEYRTNYELIRQGKMPESESILGKFLNRVLSDPKKDVVRKQKIDGTKLPLYQTVRRYFGPYGLYMQSKENGWEFGGMLMHKHQSDDEASVSVDRKKDTSIQ